MSPGVRSRVPPQPWLHTGPPGPPAASQVPEGAEPGGAAGAEEEDQQQGEEEDAGPERSHGRPEGGDGALRLLAFLCVLPALPPAGGPSGTQALQDLHPGPGQKLHPPPGLVSPGDATAAGGGECGGRGRGEHRPSPQAAAGRRVASNHWPRSAPPLP